MITKSNREKSAEALNEVYESYEEKKKKRILAEQREMKALRDKIEAPVRRREENQRSYTSFRESLRHDLLSKAIKSIYIGALQEHMVLNNNHLVIADNMVNGFIQEHGGAVSVLQSFKNKSYLLDRIRSIVEDTEEEIVKDVDKDNPDTQEIPKEKEEEMYDSLEKEDDVHAAIDAIAQRISTAEEEFIRQNAEDKKKMEEIANRVNERLAAVKDDPESTEKEEEEIEQENARIFAKGRAKIRDDRPRSIFEQMTRTLYKSIVVSESLREEYTGENGRMDMDSVIESSMCIYGFLETVNTLQLDRVDADYIEKILISM